MIQFILWGSDGVEYVFEKRFGLTFVFRQDITFIRDEITSAEIIPMGIIYEENDQYYFAPLYDKDEIEAIVKEFVEKEII